MRQAGGCARGVSSTPGPRPVSTVVGVAAALACPWRDCWPPGPVAPGPVSAAEPTLSPFVEGRHVYDYGHQALARSRWPGPRRLAGRIEAAGGGRVVVYTAELMDLPDAGRLALDWQVDGVLLTGWSDFGEATLGATLRGRLPAGTEKFMDSTSSTLTSFETWATSILARTDGLLNGRHVFDAPGVLDADGLSHAEASANRLSAKIGIPVYVDIAVGDAGNPETTAYWNSDLSDGLGTSLVIALAVSDSQIGGHVEAATGYDSSYETGSPWSFSTLWTEDAPGGDVQAELLRAIDAVGTPIDPAEVVSRVGDEVNRARDAVGRFFSDKTNQQYSLGGLLLALAGARGVRPGSMATTARDRLRRRRLDASAGPSGRDDARAGGTRGLAARYDQGGDDGPARSGGPRTHRLLSEVDAARPERRDQSALGGRGRERSGGSLAVDGQASRAGRVVAPGWSAQGRRSARSGCRSGLRRASARLRADGRAARANRRRARLAPPQGQVRLRTLDRRRRGAPARRGRGRRHHPAGRGRGPLDRERRHPAARHTDAVAGADARWAADRVDGRCLSADSQEGLAGAPGTVPPWLASAEEAALWGYAWGLEGEVQAFVGRETSAGTLGYPEAAGTHAASAGAAGPATWLDDARRTARPRVRPGRSAWTRTRSRATARRPGQVDRGAGRRDTPNGRATPADSRGSPRHRLASRESTGIRRRLARASPSGRHYPSLDDRWTRGGTGSSAPGSLPGSTRRRDRGRAGTPWIALAS